MVKSIAEYPALRDYIRQINGYALVAFDGFTGSGKSYVTTALSNELAIHVVHTDDFVIGEDESLPYPDRLDYNQLRLPLQRAHESSVIILLEGICVRECLR